MRIPEAARQALDHVAVIADPGRRGYDVFVTNDQNQLADPAETRAIMKSRVHHVRYVRGNGRDCQRDRLVGS